MNLAKVIKDISCKPFRYKQPEDFLLTRWQHTDQIDWFYLAYRCAYLVMFPMVYFLIVRVSKVSYLMKTLVYFTHWTFVMNWLHAFVALVVVLNGYIKQSEAGIVDIPCLYKFYLVLANLSQCNALCVTITYWAFMHVLKGVRIASKFFHAWNSVVVVMDFFIISVPFRFLNIIFPLIFGTAYGVFTCIYYYCGGTNYKGEKFIYKYLDWETKPGTCIALIVSGLFLIVVVQFVLYLLYKFKIYVFVKYFAEVSTRPFDND